MRWKRTEIKFWRLIRPHRPFFKRYFDGEVTYQYFGSFVVSLEHWYESAAQHRVQRTASADPLEDVATKLQSLARRVSVAARRRRR